MMLSHAAQSHCVTLKVHAIAAGTGERVNERESNDSFSSLVCPDWWLASWQTSSSSQNATLKHAFVLEPP